MSWDVGFLRRYRDLLTLRKWPLVSLPPWLRPRRTPMPPPVFSPLFMTPRFRVYTSNDLIGVELGGALKNVLAIASGAATGMGFGDNTMAALVTRGLAEMTRLGVAMGADPLTFAGLSGIGDLIVTCASRHSRNRRLGIELAKGACLEEALQKIGMVVEGVETARTVNALKERYGVEMPIATQIAKTLFEGVPVKEAVHSLMLREPKPEQEFGALGENR